MTTSWTIEQHPSYLLVIVKGDVGNQPVSEAINASRDLMRIAREEGIAKLILDMSQTTGQRSFIKRFQTIAGMAREQIRHVMLGGSLLRTAMVMNEEEIERASFTETAAENRSIRFKLCKNIGEAKLWLDVD